MTRLSPPGVDAKGLAWRKTLRVKVSFPTKIARSGRRKRSLRDAVGFRSQTRLPQVHTATLALWTAGIAHRRAGASIFQVVFHTHSALAANLPTKARWIKAVFETEDSSPRLAAFCGLQYGVLPEDSAKCGFVVRPTPNLKKRIHHATNDRRQRTVDAACSGSRHSDRR